MSYKYFEDAVGICAAFDRLPDAEKEALGHSAAALRRDAALGSIFCGGDADVTVPGVAADLRRADVAADWPDGGVGPACR